MTEKQRNATMPNHDDWRLSARPNQQLWLEDHHVAYEAADDGKAKARVPLESRIGDDQTLGVIASLAGWGTLRRYTQALGFAKVEDLDADALNGFFLWQEGAIQAAALALEALREKNNFPTEAIASPAELIVWDMRDGEVRPEDLAQAIANIDLNQRAILLRCVDAMRRQLQADAIDNLEYFQGLAPDDDPDGNIWA